MAFGDAIAAFALVALLLTITPGLDSALVLRFAISRGRNAAFATAAGICAGAMVWGIGAALGASALLAASTVAFAILKIAGAVYMVYLGVRMIYSGVFRAPRDEIVSDAFMPQSGWSAFRTGLLTNLLNPKVGAFYIALLPQFIPIDANPAAMGALLAGVHVAESMVWFALLIFGAHAARRWLAKRRVRQGVDGTTGVALVGFGAALGWGALN